MSLPPTDLPVEEVIDDVRRALADHTHAILQAEPGAGKTTVVPLRLLDEPWLGGRKIVLLEPRRVAARAAARRMAKMLGESPGDTVGWVTRDDRRIGPATRIEVVTEGVLTARLVHEPSLADTSLIIFDEFHERSLPGDTCSDSCLLSASYRSRNGSDPGSAYVAQFGLGSTPSFSVGESPTRTVSTDLSCTAPKGWNQDRVSGANSLS